MWNGKKNAILLGFILYSVSIPIKMKKQTLSVCPSMFSSTSETDLFFVSSLASLPFPTSGLSCVDGEQWNVIKGCPWVETETWLNERMPCSCKCFKHQIWCKCCVVLEHLECHCELLLDDFGLWTMCQCSQCWCLRVFLRLVLDPRAICLCNMAHYMLIALQSNLFYFTLMTFSDGLILLWMDRYRFL